MRQLVSGIARFVVSEDGPTAVEYAVMLSLILMLCIAGVRSFGSATGTMFSNISNSVGS
jgi:pilus assembly protein Flp/PilA